MHHKIVYKKLSDGIQDHAVSMLQHDVTVQCLLVIIVSWLPNSYRCKLGHKLERSLVAINAMSPDHPL